jgi:hypothetical protein
MTSAGSLKKMEPTNVKETKELSLEEIVQLAHKIGMEYVEKRREAELLELLRSSKRAQIMNDLEASGGSQKSFSETKLKRLAEAHPDYLALIHKIVDTRALADKLRIRYESYKSLFDAKRTMISLKKTEMRHL